MNLYIDEDYKVWTVDQLKADHTAMVANGDLTEEMTDFDAYLEEASGRNGTLELVSFDKLEHCFECGSLVLPFGDAADDDEGLMECSCHY